MSMCSVTMPFSMSVTCTVVVTAVCLGMRAHRGMRTMVASGRCTRHLEQSSPSLLK